VVVSPTAPSAIRRLLHDRGALIWMVAVFAIYVACTVAITRVQPTRVDKAMRVAVAVSHGRLDIDVPAGNNDTVTVNGRTYQVVSPLPIAPYLLFVPFPGLWAASRTIIDCALGIVAGWLALPLARRYAGQGSKAYWVATLGAFGTLLFDQSIQGDFYYLAHVEAMLLTFLALIEFAGPRRPWVLGAALGLAALARPALLLAAIPFGVAIVLSTNRSRESIRPLLWFTLPVALSIAVAGVYDALRFGSPVETGYGISTLANPALTKARSLGLFSLQHVANNLAFLAARGFGIRSTFPYLVPDPYGHSILLTSPALLAAVGAGVRRDFAWVLWAAALLVTVLLLLYYGGGGYATYGFRYFLDAVPFLLALVGIAARERFGALEKALIVLSVAFVCYLPVWLLFK
jgi:hypothetical protein